MEEKDIENASQKCPASSPLPKTGALHKESPKDHDPHHPELDETTGTESLGIVVVGKPTFPQTDLAQGIVGWDGQDDPQNPRNFRAGMKWGILGLTSCVTLISPLASSMFSPAMELLAKDFRITNEPLLSFSVSVYLLGYTFGPLALAPLSEIYGRRIVLSVANWFFVVWQIGCALAPNIASLIVFRLLAGIGGSACLTLGAGVISDLFSVEERGRATSVWGFGPLLGPVIGPICGGFIAQNAGWRWVYWVLLIASGVCVFGVECLNRETYAPVLIRWKMARLSRELGRADLRSAYEVDESTTTSTSGLQDFKLRHGLTRPFVLLVKSPIILLLSVYMSFVYGLLYLFFTTITNVFHQQYGWSIGIAGLSYLGIGIGFFIGLTSVALTNDRMIVKLTKRNNGKYEPEMRLPAMIIYSIILPCSFFWYGWSAAKHTHWIVPIIGMAPYGIGMMGVFLPIQTYIIDAYQQYSASGVAILTATRSLVGALLPLAGPKMFESLGLGWGNSLLGFIALAFVPVPIFFSKYGGVIRERFPV